MSDVDWANLAEEIEGVGLSELHSVENYLNEMIVHLLKLQASPDNEACDHWHSEIAAFQMDVQRRFTSFMRQRLDLGALYAGALKQVRTADRRNTLPRPWPDANPSTLDQLLNADSDDLLQQLSDANPP